MLCIKQGRPLNDADTSQKQTVPTRTNVWVCLETGYQPSGLHWEMLIDHWNWSLPSFRTGPKRPFKTFYTKWWTKQHNVNHKLEANQHINMAPIVRTYDCQLGELGCKHGLVATGLCNSVHPWLAIANLYIFKQTLLVLVILFGSTVTNLLLLQVMVVFNRSIMLALQSTANDPPSDVSWSNQRVQ